MNYAEKAKEDANTAHLYLGFIAGLSAALEKLRDAPPSVRSPIFKLMMDTNVNNVRKIIDDNKKIRDDRLIRGARHET